MKSIILSLFLSLVGIISTAQTYEIEGTVTDANGMPLPGVSIVVQNTTRGTTTDFDGNYTISNVEQGEILVFSFMGFSTKEITISSSETLKVTLDEDTQSLDEVVVVGYGTQTKKEITGAVSVVSSETIEKLNPVRVESALQGQVAGVSVTSQSGSPGSASSIRIQELLPMEITIHSY